MGVQIGILITRKGNVEYVVAGEARSIPIPRLQRVRMHPGRLQGLRFIHTHLENVGLSTEDLTDLAKLRLDMMYAITVSEDGKPTLAYGAHLLPQNHSSKPWKVLEPSHVQNVDIPFDRFIMELEDSIYRSHAVKKVDISEDRAILIATFPNITDKARIQMQELEALTLSAGIHVLDKVIQRRPKPDPRLIVGKGKLNEIVINALAMDANLLVFNQELSPSQSRAISDFSDLRVIDRTQLILDIFAKRAKTKEGKIQVELAQLKYAMPRLVGARPALSRLAGGIGTRGPGETKLEIDRRRAKERISRLEHEIKRISKKRGVTREKRSKNHVPVVSIIGYTNTGKSTLLNTLTRGKVFTADMPFATLDPSSKRLRFPRDLDVIITDTVGFLRELPEELKKAFMATLEELNNADLLLEVIDLSDPDIEGKMLAVDKILEGLSLQSKPRIKVFNKSDKVDEEMANAYATRYNGCVISAINRPTLKPLVERIQEFFLGTLTTSVTKDKTNADTRQDGP